MVQSLSISSWPLLSFLIFTFPFILTQTITAAKCHPDDRHALLTIKASITARPSSMLSDWKPATNCCFWLGVSCDDTNDRVNSLYISGISGTITPSLAKLVFLKSFTLIDVHNLSGPSPDFLFRSPKLQIIHIVDSKLSGPIPDSFGSLTHLTDLIIALNRISGRVATSISKLTSLVNLNLAINFLTGTIPDGFRHLINLSLLNLERNLLSGTIPDVFSSLTRLQGLSLSYNKFHGQIPPSISALAPNLIVLMLSHNSLTGNIPSFFGNFHKLGALDLSSNHLTGVVPMSLSNLTEISTLDLSRNSLVDPFPAMKLKNIELLDLSDNLLHLGQIPKWVTSSPFANKIKLAKCGIKMKLDDWKPKKPKYYDYIDLSDNEISRSPVWLLNQTSNLRSFKASGNQLKFNIGSLKIAKTVKDLDLSRNQIFGKVPMAVAAAKRLNVSHNHNLCGSPLPLPPCKI